MKNRRTKYFNVYYSDADTDGVEQIMSVVDGMYEWAVDFFELKETAQMFDFYLCPGVEAFKLYAEKSDGEYQNWMVGNTDYTINRICVLSPRVVRDRSFEDMIKVIKHEIIHIVLSALEAPDKVSICVAEGIAVALAEQINLPGLDREDPPKFVDLMDEGYFYENDGYTFSGAYVLHLLKKYGKDVFKSIYSGKASIEEYLYDGFEKEAISGLITG